MDFATGSTISMGTTRDVMKWAGQDKEITTIFIPVAGIFELSIVVGISKNIWLYQTPHNAHGNL